jgi:tetratricopeptide (TPR) repeat protein
MKDVNSLGNWQVAENYIAQGDFFLAKGEKAVAIDCYKQAVALNPSISPTVYCSLGNLLLEQNLLEEAEAVFQQLTKEYPKNPQGLMGLAKIKVCLKDWYKALEIWETTIQQFPENPDARIEKGCVLIELQQLDQAEAILSESLGLTKHPPVILRALAQLSEDQNDWEKAANYWYQLISISADDWAAQIRYGRCLKRQQKLDVAEKVFRDAISNFPSCPECLEELAILQQDQNNWSIALETWKSLTTEYPNYAPGIAGQVNSLLELSQYQEAQQLLKQHRKNPRKHILITGTGRAGTTALIQLLTELDLDTGFKIENYKNQVFTNCNAGLEHNICRSNAPYIVKSPETIDDIDQILGRPDILVEHVIIPIREIGAASKSRIRVQEAANLVKYIIPGGLTGTLDKDQQEEILLKRFFKLIYNLEKYQISYTTLLFPRLTLCSDYLYNKLFFLFKDRIDFITFSKKFKQVMKPQDIHITSN